MASLYLGIGPLEQELVRFGGVLEAAAVTLNPQAVWHRGVGVEPPSWPPLQASYFSCGPRFWGCGAM